MATTDIEEEKQQEGEEEGWENHVIVGISG